MKSPQATHCLRCGDLLSHYEKLNVQGALCAFCDHIRSETLQIQEEIHGLAPKICAGIITIMRPL
jgi:NMD protein affecting ribosome stability and mRNA decay